LGAVVEVGPRHVNELAGLVADRGDDLRVTVPGGADGDAGGEVEEQVAVHVADDGPAPLIDDERVDAGVRRGDEGRVPVEQLAGVRAGQVGPEVRDLFLVEMPHGPASWEMTTGRDYTTWAPGGKVGFERRSTHGERRGVSPTWNHRARRAYASTLARTGSGRVLSPARRPPCPTGGTTRRP